MATKRFLKRKRSKSTRSKSKRGGSKTMKNKKQRWTTAIDAAQTTLKKTGSLDKAKQVLKSQALVNARKLFGSVGEQM
jgi:hypothetical protein